MTQGEDQPDVGALRVRSPVHHATVLTFLVCIQLAWVATLTYGAVWLLR